MWHCFSRQSSADGNVVTSFNQKTNKENLIKLRNKQRQPYQIKIKHKDSLIKLGNKEINLIKSKKKQRQSHSIKKITDNLIQLKNKQRQPHSIRTLLNSKYLKLNRKVPGGLAKCQRIVEEAKTRVLCKGRAGKNKEKQRRAKVEQRFLLKRDHRRLKPADCHVTRSHNHVVFGIGG